MRSALLVQSQLEMKFVFTTCAEKKMKKCGIDPSNAVKSADRESCGGSLLAGEGGGTILAGMDDGSFAEYSANGLWVGR